MSSENGKILKFNIAGGKDINLSRIENRELLELYVDKILNKNLESDIVIDGINKEMQKRKIVPKDVTVSFNFIINGEEITVCGTSF